jgi:antitoxin YefM
MRHTTLTDFRGNIARHLDEVENDRVELIVTRQNHEPCVVMPLAELEGLRETLHLLASRANANHLFSSIAELEAGKAKRRRLIRS